MELCGKELPSCVPWIVNLLTMVVPETIAWTRVLIITEDQIVATQWIEYVINLAHRLGLNKLAGSHKLWVFSLTLTISWNNLIDVRKKINIPYACQNTQLSTRKMNTRALKKDYAIWQLGVNQIMPSVFQCLKIINVKCHNSRIKEKSKQWSQ